MNGASVSVVGPVAGTWSLFMTAAAPVQGATLTLDGARGGTIDFTTKLTTNFAVGDLVHTGFNLTVPANGPLTATGFAAPDLITSVCGAEAKGKVFSSGPVADRASLLSAYAKANSKQQCRDRALRDRAHPGGDRQLEARESSGDRERPHHHDRP